MKKLIFLIQSILSFHLMNTFFCCQPRRWPIQVDTRTPATVPGRRRLRQFHLPHARLLPFLSVNVASYVAEFWQHSQARIMFPLRTRARAGRSPATVTQLISAYHRWFFIRSILSSHLMKNFSCSTRTAGWMAWLLRKSGTLKS